MGARNLQQRRLARVCAILASACVLGACSSSRNFVTVQDSTTLTKGRELTDLQRALEAGAINPQEFEVLRQVVLKRPN